MPDPATPELADAACPEIERRVRAERRSHGAYSFLYGSLRPRRRSGRRRGDEQRTFLDWHEPGVLYLSLAILLMSCVDALLTLNILTAGGRELNGFMDWLIRSDPLWFVAAKILITGSGVTLLAVVVKRQFFGRLRVLRILQLFCAGYFLLMAWEVYLLGLLFPHTWQGGIASWLALAR
ncbi:MAG: hypothetical protein D6727_07895 [Gammaproteobacteria bacterium]|nr:MAG: hypothetical protein D6727_07895 [Gammaproteobacteria bacterium]